MSTLQLTVAIEAMERYNAIKMSWKREVDMWDLQLAFRRMTEMLNEAEAPTHVMIDITNNSVFPLLATIKEALRGPLMHPKGGEWLILGTSDLARIFAKTLSDITDRTDVHWFADEAQAMDCLERLRAQAAPAATVTESPEP